MTDQPNEQDRHDEAQGAAVTPDAPATETHIGEVPGSEKEHGPTLTQGEKFTPEKLGDAAIKFATETVYAAAGLANVLAEKAKEFYEAQRKQIAANAPEGVDPNFRKFVDSMPDQFKTLMDDASKAFHDLSERGRTTMSDLQEQVQAAWKQRENEERTGAFDLKDAAEATQDAASAVAPEAPLDPEPPKEADGHPGEAKGDVRSD